MKKLWFQLLLLPCYCGMNGMTGDAISTTFTIAASGNQFSNVQPVTTMVTE